MILVRTEIQCKWGRVQEVLERTRANFEQLGGRETPLKSSRILTDLSGSFDTVIIESEVESLDAYFAFLNAMFKSPEFEAMQAAQTGDSPYQSGKRTFYTIEAAYEAE